MTGVQTCALPISAEQGFRISFERRADPRQDVSRREGHFILPQGVCYSTSVLPQVGRWKPLARADASAPSSTSEGSGIAALPSLAVLVR